MAQLLITGGAGFIGSHTCLTLLDAGYDLVVIDNFSNSSSESLRRVSNLARIGPDSDRLKVVEGDIRSKDDLDRAFLSVTREIDAVIHFAGLKAVGESFMFPLRYWEVNVGGSRTLFEAMRRHGCRTIVFSSSATLYGYLKVGQISEKSKIQPVNPYGHTKAAVEQILTDLASSEDGWRIACLRYFNPVGAHSSGLIGEAPNGVPNNLFPLLSEVAGSKRDQLTIYGDDWPTKDGSAVRDYIHVMDLAEGHLAALETLRDQDPQSFAINLGSGQGSSVLEVVDAYEKVSGRRIPYTIGSRREGDVAYIVADPSLAFQRLGWKTKLSLEDMCRDSWGWQKLNPSEYWH